MSRAELDLGSAEDPVGAALLAEITSYASASVAADSHTAPRPGDLLLPIHIRMGDLDLRLFSTIMTLCTPHDVTLQELSRRGVLPGRSRLRALLAAEFRGVCGARADYVRRYASFFPTLTPHTGRRGGSAIDARTVRHPGSMVSQRRRKRIEECFGWLKDIALLRKLKHRGLFRVGWIFTFAAAAYNLVRIRNLRKLSSQLA